MNQWQLHLEHKVYTRENWAKCKCMCMHTREYNNLVLLTGILSLLFYLETETEKCSKIKLKTGESL